MFLQNLWWSLVVTGFNWPGLVEVVWGMFQHSSCAIIFLVVDYTAAFAAAASFVGEREKFLFRYNNPHPTKTSFNSIVEVQRRCKSNNQYLGSQQVLARFACPNRVKWQINKKIMLCNFAKVHWASLGQKELNFKNRRFKNQQKFDKKTMLILRIWFTVTV